MKSKLEKQFFDTFGIKPKYTYLVTDTFYTNNAHTYTETKDDLIDYFEGKNCGRYKVIKVYKNYPQITNRILLELICIANQHEDYPISTNIKNIQARTLRILLRTEKFYKNYYGYDRPYKKLVKQVRTLFAEAENE